MMAWYTLAQTFRAILDVLVHSVTSTTSLATYYTYSRYISVEVHADLLNLLAKLHYKVFEG